MRLDQMNTSSYAGFQFSGVRPETLGATEYTLVTLLLDKSGSVSDFATELHKVKATVVESCKKSPRADFILLRVVEFNSNVDEVHGFMPLNQIDIGAYQTPNCSGLTALHDACFSAVGSMNAYAKTLSDQEYLVNALTIIVTDGDNTTGRTKKSDVAAEIKQGIQSENLESSKTILIAVNAKEHASKLQSFSTEVGINEYQDVGDATPSSLAKLAGFVSKSISATSQAIGTGGPSQAIVF